MEDSRSSAWKDPLNVSVIQPRLALGDVDDNLERALSLIDGASKDGPPDMIILPEVFATGFPYDMLPELSGSAGKIMDTLSGKAHGISAHIMFTLVVKEGERYYNRFVSLSPDGKIESIYDKTHLFSRSGEDGFFTAGSALSSFEIKGARLAPLICYEVRFPELSRKLVLAGADILIYPAQWPSFRIFQWETLLRARAIENQCYVIGVNGFGAHGNTEMGGHSMIISPFGDVLSSVGSIEGRAAAVIGPERIRDVRGHIPVLFERRPDLY